MSVPTVYDIAPDYEAEPWVDRNGIERHPCRATRNGVPFGPLHATPDSARSAAVHALYLETQGYPPLRVATEGVPS